MTSEFSGSRRHQPDEEDGRVVRGLARLLAIGLLSLIGVTWKLWTPQTDFPQVPLFQAACDWPGWCDWICLATLITASTSLLIVGRRGFASRVASSGIACSLAGFFLLDQHRLQPWAWQFLLLLILLTIADDATTRRCWIWLTMSIYFWSALSKLDYNFFHDQGPALIEGFKHAIGLRGTINRWGESFNIWAALALAVGEFAVAVLLAMHRTRRMGVWLAVVMHATLLVALGPLGLQHSWGVLLWNLFFAIQTWLACGGVAPQPSYKDASCRTAERISTFRHFANRLASGIIVAAILWPILEPVERCDHWLAWAVYSARAGQQEILITSDESPFGGPIEYDQVLRTVNGASNVYYRPNVGGWSLKELGVPSYPQFRFQIAVGKDLQRRLELENLQIVRWRRNRWNGKVTDEQVIELSKGQNPSPSIWNTQPRWSNRE